MSNYIKFLSEKVLNSNHIMMIPLFEYIGFRISSIPYNLKINVKNFPDYLIDYVRRQPF